MNELREIKFKNLKIKNFMSYNEVKEFDFSDMTVISGNNEQGKSTIGKAIVWTLYGVDINGNSKNLDRLKNDENTSAGIKSRLTFILDGEEVKIERNLTKQQSIKLNGKKAIQSEVDNLIGIDKEVFLSIFNPRFFIEELTPKKQKEMLLSFFSELEPWDFLQDDYEKEKLAEIKRIKNEKELIKEIKAEMKDQEKVILKTEGQLEQLEESLKQEVDIIEKVFDKDSVIKDLNDKYYSITSNDAVKEIRTLKDTITLKKQQLSRLVENLEDLIKNSKSKTALLQEKKGTLAERYKELTKEFIKLKEQLDSPACPTCEQSVTGELKEKLKNDIIKKGKETKEKIEKTTKEGKQVSEEINTTEKEKQKKHEEFAKDIESQEKEIKSLEKKLEDKMEEANVEKIKEEVQKIRSEIERLTEEKNKVIAHNEKIRVTKKQMEDQKKRKEEAQKKKIKLEKDFESNKDKIEILQKLEIRKLEKIQEELSKHLSRVEIQLDKVIQGTGEIVEHFELLYDGRNIKNASESGRYRIGIEVSDLLKEKLNLNIPLFLDNTDLIAGYHTKANQVFECRVVKGQELKVEGVALVRNTEEKIEREKKEDKSNESTKDSPSIGGKLDSAFDMI